MTFARYQFELSERQDDGSPLVAHLQAVWRATGKCPAMLADAPPIPAGTEALWRDFLALHDSRGSSGFGPMRITFNDIDAWQRVTGAKLKPWEIDLVRQADNLWLSDFAPKPKVN